MWAMPTQKQLAKIPKLYSTESIEFKDKVIHMHFFIAGCDWYVAEYDGEDLFYGYAILNMDYLNAEWRYFSLSEMKEIKLKSGIEIERDINWRVRKASEVSKIRQGRAWQNKKDED